MKLRLIVSCFCIIAALTVANAQENASSLLEKAYMQAGKENKKMFVLFHASWCGWCKKMDKNMTDEACSKYFNDNYVIVHLTVKESPKNKDLENPGGDDILKRFKGEQAGLPFWVILDAKGNMLTDSFDSKGENLGCPSTSDEVKEFLAKLKKTSKLTDKQLAVIRETFTIKK